MKQPSCLAALVALLLLTAPAFAQPPAAPAKTTPGEGVFCAWMVVALVAEVGDRCFAGEDPDFQREAHAAVSRLDAYVLKNSNMGPAGVSAFKRQQGVTGAHQAKLCQDDALKMYRALHAKGSAALRSIAAAATAHDGPPTWGDCF